MHWKYINGILLQLAQGKVELSVAIMRYANSKKNVRKLFKLKDNFGQVITKKVVNANFLFKFRFNLDRVEEKQQKIKLKKLSLLSPNSVHIKFLIEQF